MNLHIKNLHSIFKRFDNVKKFFLEVFLKFYHVHNMIIKTYFCENYKYILLFILKLSTPKKQQL